MTLLADIRYTFRMLKANRVFALGVLLTLAVGIGINAAMFSVMDAVLLKPLPYPQADRVMVLQTESPRDSSRNQPVSYDDFADWRRQSNSFEAMAAVRQMVMSLKTESLPERVQVARVSSDYFRVLQVHAALGRTFAVDEDSPGKEHVAIVSHSLWQRSLGGATSVIGRQFDLDGGTYQIVGVLPAGAISDSSIYPTVETDVWIPLAPTPAEHVRGMLAMRVLARLKPGVSMATAGAEMATINRQIEAAYPDSHKGWLIQIAPLQEILIGSTRQTMLVLVAAVGCVLLTTCVNLANLLLARAVSRQGEFAMRTALGASGGRIVRQLVTESAFMAMLGGGAGLFFAWTTVHTAKHLLQSWIPRAGGAAINIRVLLFTAGVSMLSGILFGMAPVAHASRLSLVTALRQRSPNSLSRVSGIALRALVVAQTAFAILLVVGAGLMIRSFSRLSNVPPGFVTDGLTASQVDLGLSRYGTPVLQAQFYTSAMRKLREAPGVEGAAAASRAPMLGGNQSTSYQIDSHLLPPAERPSANARLVTPRYFETMKIPLLRGRDFTDQDQEDTPSVMIITREAAVRFWPGEDAIGRRIQIFPEKTWRTVVGVVGDVKLRGLEVETAPALYIPYRQNPFPTAARTSYIVVRSQMDAQTVSATLRQELASIDDGQAVAPVQSFSDVVKNSLALRKLTTLLTAAFACMSFLLALIGVYGVLAFFVNIKRHDIGVRSALGAQRTDILWWILKQGMTMTAWGVLLGLLLSALTARYLSHQLFAVSATDPATYISVAIAVLMAATVACYLPALRATRLASVALLRES